MISVNPVTERNCYQNFKALPVKQLKSLHYNPSSVSFAPGLKNIAQKLVKPTALATGATLLSGCSQRAQENLFIGAYSLLSAIVGALISSALTLGVLAACWGTKLGIKWIYDKFNKNNKDK